MFNYLFIVAPPLWIYLKKKKTPTFKNSWSYFSKSFKPVPSAKSSQATQCNIFICLWHCMERHWKRFTTYTKAGRAGTGWITYSGLFVKLSRNLSLSSVIFLKHLKYGNSVFYSDNDDKNDTLTVNSFVFFPFFSNHQRWYTLFQL